MSLDVWSGFQGRKMMVYIGKWDGGGVGVNEWGMGLNEWGVGLNEWGMGENEWSVGLNEWGMDLNEWGVGLNYVFVICLLFCQSGVEWLK